MEDASLMQNSTAFVVSSLDPTSLPADIAAHAASPDQDSHPFLGICTAALFGLLCWVSIARAIF